MIAGILGEGGSGIVYDARWGHREVALKVLHPALVATAKEREQFLAEARRLAEIHHPGVVKVLAVGETADHRPYLAMEKLGGEAMATRLGRGPVPLAQALELFAQLADAVDALHARGLVHRDLKPENVVLVAGVDGREHAVLLDFGIAKELAAAASTTTQDGGVRGTPAYMAPERFFGQPASVATDVYELAVTLFAMLAGRLPWEDCADPEVRLDPRRLAELAPQVPPALDLEVRRALSTRAQNRPASAGELRAAVMSAAGLAWSARTTLDVSRSPTNPPRYAPQATSDLRHDDDSQPVRAPLAGAAAGTTGTTTRRSRRLAAWIALGVVAIAGIGVAAARLSGPGAAAEQQQRQAAAAEPAPVIEPTAPVIEPAAPATAPGLAAVEAPADLATARAELAAAVAHLPDDLLFAFGVQVRTLGEDRDLRGLIDLFADSSTGMLMRVQAGVGACGLDLRSRTDWLVAGGAVDEGSLDVVAAGRWTRIEMEGCLATAISADQVEPMTDRVTKLHSPRGDRMVAWLDDRTFLLSSRPEADARWMTARLDDVTPPGGKLAALLPEVDLEALMWFAGDGAGGRVAIMDKQSGIAAMWGSLRAEPAEVSLDVRLRYPTARKAKEAQQELAGQAAEIGLNQLMGRFEIALDPTRPTVVHSEVAMPRMIVGLVMQALQTGALTP